MKIDIKEIRKKRRRYRVKEIWRMILTLYLPGLILMPVVYSLTNQIAFVFVSIFVLIALDILVGYRRKNKNHLLTDINKIMNQYSYAPSEILYQQLKKLPDKPQNFEEDMLLEVCLLILQYDITADPKILSELKMLSLEPQFPAVEIIENFFDSIQVTDTPKDKRNNKTVMYNNNFKIVHQNENNIYYYYKRDRKFYQVAKEDLQSGVGYYVELFLTLALLIGCIFAYKYSYLNYKMFLILFNLVGFFGGAGLVFMHYRRSKGVKLTRISSEGNPNLKTELFKKYTQGRIVADVMFVVCLILTVFLERVLRYGRNYYVFFWVILVTSLILLGSMSYMIWIQLRRR